MRHLVTLFLILSSCTSAETDKETSEFVYEDEIMVDWDNTPVKWEKIPGEKILLLESRTTNPRGFGSPFNAVVYLLIEVEELKNFDAHFLELTNKEEVNLVCSLSRNSHEKKDNVKQVVVCLLYELDKPELINNCDIEYGNCFDVIYKGKKLIHYKKLIPGVNI